MKKTLVVIFVVAVVLASGFVAYRRGWVSQRLSASAVTSSQAQPAGGVSTQPGASGVSGANAPAGASVPGTPAAPGPLPSALPSDVNLIALDMGGHVESATSGTLDDARVLIDAKPPHENYMWAAKVFANYPQDFVFSFLDRQPALIGSVVVTACRRLCNLESAPKDLEIWASMESPTTGFKKVASFTLAKESFRDSSAVWDQGVEQTASFEPVEARYIKLRVLSNYGDKLSLVLAKVRVIEARHAGYTSLLARNPDLATMVVRASTPSQPASRSESGKDLAPTDCPPAASVAASLAAPPAAAHPESRRVLVVSGTANWGGRGYAPLHYKPSEGVGLADFSIYERLTFKVVLYDAVSRAMLLPSEQIDTVVLHWVCDPKKDLPDTFLRALMDWVAAGHKLIISDSDMCDTGVDYSFLPYLFSTSNPGARGAKSGTLRFVEENPIANGKRDDPGFLDVESWLVGTGGNKNELGDSNTVTAYDPHWCGMLFGKNVLEKSGFQEAYTHYGRGLIIYNGFDVKEQGGQPVMKQLLTRELAQPFDPDNLLCSVRLGDFVITTEERLKKQFTTPGKTYTYPLSVLSNQGYKGTVKLSLNATPTEAAPSFKFAPDQAQLGELANTNLTVTLPANVPVRDRALAVRGTDASGKTSTLCLYLTERKTGGLQVLCRRSANRPTKSLEIILDASGSMKTPLGKKTRWATALDVLNQVLAKLPADFNVGLRIYGHRESSRSPRTCTDSELVVPLGKLDRNRIAAAANAVKPRGETPLVYSVLQTPADLKAMGGGSVILITDGEESCHGDLSAAAKKLKESGLNVSLNIVGFTLTSRQAQQQLTTLAEASGGRFYSAQNGESLARAVLIAAIERFPYTVFDAAGHPVARGEAGDAGVELPPGEYKVVVRAGDQDVVANGVRVAAAADTTLKLALKGEQFVIER